MGFLNFLGETFDKKLVEEYVNGFLKEVDSFMSAYEKVGLEKMYGYRNQLNGMQTILDNYFRVVRSHENDFHHFMQNKISILGHGKMTIFQADGIIMAAVGAIHNIIGQEYFKVL